MDMYGSTSICLSRARGNLSTLGSDVKFDITCLLDVIKNVFTKIKYCANSSRSNTMPVLSPHFPLNESG
jgi:hypothetical protein